MTNAEKLFELYQSHSKVMGRYDISRAKRLPNGKLKGRALTVQEEPTVEHWERHLAGATGIGLVPIQENNKCVWGLIDIDTYTLDLGDLSNRIKEKDLPLVLVRTKSGGAHVTLFTSEPVSARLMRTKLKSMELALGFNNNEIFPKQETIGPEDFGNWVNMPYFGGDSESDSDGRYAIVEENRLSLEEFLAHAKDLAISAADLGSFAAETVAGDGEFEGAPPCLLYYIEHGFPEGSRNHALFSLGVFARKKFPEEWEDKVNEYNRRFMTPGTYQEVQAIIKSLNKKAYAYKCKDQPLAVVCNKQECVNCTFGVDDPKTAKQNRPCVLDTVDRPITKMIPPPGSGDDPYYILKANGRELAFTVDELSSQTKFSRKYLITFDRLLLKVTEDRWAKAVNTLLEDKVEEEMPVDAGPEGQLMLHVEAFCAGKVQARSRDELLLGKPWTDEGRTYFCTKDLYKYLIQQNFRAFKEGELYAIFRRYGVEHHGINIKGRYVRCWSLPEVEQQTEDFDDPEITRDTPF